MTRRTVADTDRARNINVAVDGALTIDEMEEILDDIAESLDLVRTHTTTLSRKKYPGNRHWHYKQQPKARGTLDVTHWPDAALVWVTIREAEPQWVHEAGARIAEMLDAHRELMDQTRSEEIDAP